MLDTRKAQELDLVEILEDLPEYEVKKGEIGVVVEVFDNPDEAYDLEFVDESGTSSRFAYSVKPKQIINIYDLAKESFERGLVLANEGNHIESERQFKRAINLVPNCIVNLHNLVVNSFIGSKQWDNLISGLRLVLRLNPAYEAPGYSLESFARNNLAMAYQNKGAQIASEGDAKRALASFGMALAVGPSLEGANLIKRNLASAYTSLGIQAAEEGDYDTSLAFLSLACEIDPSEKARYNLGIAYAHWALQYMERHEFDQAIRAFDYAMDTGLRIPEIYNNYGIALASIGCLEEAALAFETALDLATEDKIVIANLNLVLKAKEQIEAEAEFTIEQVKADFSPPPPMELRQFEVPA